MSDGIAAAAWAKMWIIQDNSAAFTADQKAVRTKGLIA